MARNSIVKSIARMTRSLRGMLTRKEFARLTRVPRTLFMKGGVGERVIELEDRVSRLQLGWNHHIPGLLESMSEALDAAYRAEDVHRRIDTIREDLDRLAARLEFHLIDQRSLSSGCARAVTGSGALTLAISDNRGFIIADAADDLPVTPGSIQAMSVGPMVEMPHDGDGLDGLLAKWFALLSPGGQLEIARSHLVDGPDPSWPNDVDFAARRRLELGGRLCSSSQLPTDDQILQALGRCGFVSIAVRSAARDSARTLSGLRPAGSHA